MFGFSMPAAGEGQDMELVGEAWGEMIEDMGIASQSRQEQESLAISAPIQVVQIDSIDMYKVTFVRRMIHPSSL
jgi:hypothetical protein